MQKRPAKLGAFALSKRFTFFLCPALCRCNCTKDMTKRQSLHFIPTKRASMCFSLIRILSGHNWHWNLPLIGFSCSMWRHVIDCYRMLQYIYSVSWVSSSAYNLLIFVNHSFSNSVCRPPTADRSRWCLRFWNRWIWIRVLLKNDLRIRETEGQKHQSQVT